jgi:hypothetical protein
MNLSNEEIIIKLKNWEYEYGIKSNSDYRVVSIKFDKREALICWKIKVPFQNVSGICNSAVDVKLGNMVSLLAEIRPDISQSSRIDDIRSFYENPPTFINIGLVIPINGKDDIIKVTKHNILVFEGDEPKHWKYSHD